jgi:hypothetical protein
MDAFLTSEALQTLEALMVLSFPKNSFGLLLGHKRARRFIVENILPAPADFRLEPGRLERLDRLFAGRIIGYFGLDLEAKKKKDLLQPLAAGRLFLGVVRRKQGGLGLKPSVIDYDGRFALVPVEIVREKARRR